MKPDNIILLPISLRNTKSSTTNIKSTISFSDFMWFVGFFEGEGSIVYNIARKNLSISIVSTDYENVERCKNIIKWGTIQGPYSKANRKNWWYWSICSGPAVVSLISEMYEYLSPRRQSQVVAAINKYHLRTDMRHRKKSVCGKGHILDEENRMINHNSGRICKKCFTTWKGVYNARRRELYATQH